MEEDTPVEIAAKVDGLVTSYELIELGGGSSITVEDLNDVTEGWLELVSGMGGLSEEQIKHIRSQCVLSIQSTTTKKRAASTSHAGVADRGGSSNTNSRGRSQKRNKQAPSTPATKKSVSRGNSPESNDNRSDKEEDGDSDEDDFEPKGRSKKGPPPSQSQDDEEQESPLRDAAADRAAEAARLRLEQQKMLIQQPKSPDNQESEQESEQESDDESEQAGAQSARAHSKRPTSMDLAWRQVAIDEKEGGILDLVAETETEKRMEPAKQQNHQKQRASIDSTKSLMSGNTGSQDDIIQEEDDDEEMVKEDDRGTKLQKAIEYLAEMRVRRDNYRNRRGSERYDSPYLLVRLPSLMNQTKMFIDGGFEDGGERALPLGEIVRHLIDDYVDLYDLGMESAVSFLDAEDKACLPVTFSSLATLANDLEMSMTPTIEENTRYRDVKRAVEYARDSKLIDLPSGQSIKYLAKVCLTMNEPTRNHLFVLVHLAAGCSIFSAIKIDDLTIGKHPILSGEVMQILEYNKESMPEDADDLLRRYKAIFDDRDVTYSDKRKVMDSFLRIRLEILNLDDEHWKEVDKSGPDKMAEAPRSRFFNILSRQNNAMIALTMVVASSFLYTHTLLGLDNRTFLTGEGVDELLYRNSMASVYQSVGTKILMPKTYSGKATTEYMNSIYTGLDNLIDKARTGGRGRERSTYDDDISILFDLDHDDVDDHSDLLDIFSICVVREEESDDDDDMEVEEGENM